MDSLPAYIIQTIFGPQETLNSLAINDRKFCKTTKWKGNLK